MRIMKTILTVPETARILHCAEQKIRIRMRRKLWDLGNVISPKEAGKQAWTYEIYLHKLENFLGREITEEEYQKAIKSMREEVNQNAEGRNQACS